MPTQPASFTLTRTGLARIANLLFNNGSAMGSAGAKLRLCTSTAGYTNASTSIANEVSDSGYPSGGLSLTVASSAWNEGAGHHRITFNDVSLTPGANLTFRYAALCTPDGTLMLYWTWAANETLIGGTEQPFQGLFYYLKGDS